MNARIPCFVFVLSAAACGTDDPVVATAPISGSSSSTTQGMATFSASDGQVTLEVTLSNAPPGAHGLHLHETGDCSAADGTSAGGHWNPDGHNHGEWGSTDHHLGDVGNITVAADGTGRLTFETDRWAVGDGSTTDVVGKAVIVHANPDDYVPPAGNAGARIGCGVVASP